MLAYIHGRCFCFAPRIYPPLVGDESCFGNEMSHVHQAGFAIATMCMVNGGPLGYVQALTYAIEQSCLNKARIVGLDEREAGLRATLNLGHTFGHAIETWQGYGESCLQLAASLVIMSSRHFLGLGQPSRRGMHLHRAAQGCAAPSTGSSCS